MSKLLLVYLLALLAHLNLSQIPGNPCKDNDVRCLDCQAQKERPNECKACAFQKTIDRKSCGGKISIDNCISQKENSDICEVCSFGYQQSGDRKSCQKTSIKDCIYYFRSIDTGMCVACKGGKVSNFTHCVEGPPEEKKIPNCQFYVLHSSGTYECALCTKDYSVVKATNECTKDCGTGCASCWNKQCTECNMVLGYYMEEPGKCVYKGFPTGIDPFDQKTEESEKSKTEKSNVFTLSAVFLCSIAYFLL